jgi:peptide/nickel transport system permease protein
LAGLFAIVTLYAIAFVALLIERYSFEELNAGMRGKPPSAEHWLGTDRSGRDVYSRLVKGCHVSLAAGFAPVVIVMTVGVTLGAMAGFFGGFIDNLIMRFTDILLSIPLLLLLITAASLFQPALKTTIIVIGLSSWPGTARWCAGNS